MPPSPEEIQEEVRRLQAERTQRALRGVMERMYRVGTTPYQYIISPRTYDSINIYRSDFGPVDWRPFRERDPHVPPDAVPSNEGAGGPLPTSERADGEYLALHQSASSGICYICKAQDVTTRNYVWLVVRHPETGLLVPAIDHSAAKFCHPECVPLEMDIVARFV